MPFSVLGCTASVLLSFSSMRFWPTIKTLAGCIVDGFLLSICPSCSFLPYRSNPQWGLRVSCACYLPDSSFIVFLRYFMEVTAPPACSAPPCTVIASWSATTYLAKPDSWLSCISIGYSTTRHMRMHWVWNCRPEKKKKIGCIIHSQL